MFCAIIAGNEESEMVAEGEHLVAFRDKFPRAPVHVLVVTRDHIGSAHQLGPDDDALLGSAFEMIRHVAMSEGIDDGYRVATNIGRKGGQAIPHLHFHVLGGRQLLHVDSGPTPEE